MKFHNTRPDQELNFTICGKAYKVEPCGEVDIDPAHVPFVLAQGTAVEPGKCSVKKHEAETLKVAKAPVVESHKPKSAKPTA